MALGLLDFTLENTSPMITYLPGTTASPGGSQLGWQVNQTDDSLLYFTSRPGASLLLQFYGTALYLYGSASCPFNVTLDFETSSPPMTTEGFIYFTENLTQEMHFLNLTVGGSGNTDEQIIFEYATISTEYTSDVSPTAITYDGGSTDHIPIYNGTWTTINSSISRTSSFGSSVSVNFTGIAVGISGPSNVGPGSMLYGVLLDAWPAWSFASVSSNVTDTTLFYQGGLDPTQEHTLTLMDLGSDFAFNTITVFETDETAGSPITSEPTPSPTSQSSNKHSTVVKIVAPIVAILGLLILSAAFWTFRRKRQNRRKATVSGPFALRLSRAFRDQKVDAMTLPPLQTRTELSVSPYSTDFESSAPRKT
ncbi:hypothetical protein CERSUDRAFT_116776 [Gelatoporia subvermispora B]|uniref:Uncharacterized protein n=1 Tax=Ceriporiopsis subvermispora (strain B) TaxID=914234 RepID=M2R7E8_CERS8|nr:hypothetical protein CERSUDRAFT_116776 [Gelatoporia subvermispora B]